MAATSSHSMAGCVTISEWGRTITLPGRTWEVTVTYSLPPEQVPAGNLTILELFGVIQRKLKERATLQAK